MCLFELVMVHCAYESSQDRHRVSALRMSVFTADLAPCTARCVRRGSNSMLNILFHDATSIDRDMALLETIKDTRRQVVDGKV